MACSPAWLARFMACLLYVAVSCCSSLAFGGNCASPQTMAVASGGTASVNLLGCSAAGLDGMPVPPSHGSVPDVNPAVGNGTGQVTYVNNGDGALSDTFSILDDVNNVIVFTVTVAAPASPITVTPASVPNPSISTAYSQSLSASGGVAPYTYSLSSGSLPAGLSLSSAGVISGTPTASGSFTFAVGVHDSTTPTALTSTKSYSMTIALPTFVLSPGSPPAGTISLPYSQQLSTSGGTAPYSYMVQVGLGTLPAGLSMSAGGLISGTPTATGSSTFSVKVTDSTTGTGPMMQAQNMTITINATPTIVVGPASLSAATVAAAYSQTLTGSGGTAPYTFAVTAGALPAGLSLSSAGVLSGTPTAGGAFNFTVTATDFNAFSGSHAYALTVNAPTVTVAPASLPAATVAAAYSQSVTAGGGTAPYTYAITAGALPAGTSLSSAGVLSGTPTAGGTFNFTVSATDSSTGTGPYAGSKAYALTVNVPTIAVAPASLSAMTVGSGFSQSAVASGGIAPYTYSVSAGALPTGLSLAANGTLSGTPTVAGAFNFTVTATDSSGGTGPYTGSRAYSVTVSAGLPVAGAVSASVAYNSSANPITLNLSGGTPTSVAVASAAAHGTATASGTSISYTPVAGYAGSDSFTYTATNGSGTSGAATVTLTITQPTLTITPSASWTAVDGNSYTQTLTWSGGSAPYSSYSVTGLPAGLTMTGTSGSSLTISGTPTAAGSFSVTASATDSSTGSGPFTKSQPFTLTVTAPTMTLTPAGPTLAPVYGTAYSQSFSAGGGVAPYTYALSGSLPTGLNWSAGTATLSGTPIQSGSFPVTVTATDNSTGTGAPFSKAVAYTIVIAAPTISLTPVSLPGVAVGQSYSTTVSASGGIAPYSFAISVGALPSGISLNSTTGVVSGTPNAAGSFNFTVSASDTNAFAGTRAYTIAVGVPTLALTPASLPAAAVATAYSATFSTSGGTAPYSYALSAGSLPTGISLNPSTGVLSGTTVQAGSFPITVQATDSSTGAGAPFTVQGSYTLNVSAPTISLAPGSLTGGAVAVSYSATISASGGAAPYTYSLTSGALPAGVALNTSSGALSGTPTVAGIFNFTVKALDTNGFSGSKAYSLAIGAATLTLTPVTLPNPTAETAYSTTLTAAGGTAPYSFAIASGALPTGLTLNPATGLLSGTTNLSGSFTVSISATDSSTGVGAPFNASRSYTLNVAAPTITLTPGVIAGAKVNVAYSQQFAAGGGGAPYAYTIAAGGLPAGLALNAATGMLNGTPTAAGSFAFTVRAADSQNFAAQQALTLTVTQAQPVVANDSASTPANQAVTVNVTANDSGPISGISISTPPAHGTTTVTGLNVLYTPANNFFGSDSFSYVAAGAGGTSAPATVAVTVTPLAAPVAVAQNASVLAGQTVTLHATSGASGGPFTAVAIVSPPSAGTAVVNGTDIVYTSVIGNSGDIHFSFTLANAFGVSAAVTATISVNPMPVAGTHSATVNAGAAVNIDLMAGATGGPFTAANIVTVSPAAAGTAVIRDIGTAGKPSYQMTFSAASAFSGAATISYTLSNVYATSALGSINVTVTKRRDMSADPQVSGLLGAQADSARRFATAQLSNFARRLETLHGDGWGQSGIGLSLAPPPPDRRASADVPGWSSDDIDRVVGAPLQPYMRKVGWPQQAGAGRRASDSAAGTNNVLAANDTQSVILGLPETPVQQENQKQVLSLWVGGAVDFGQHEVNGQRAGFKFTTNGVSAGGDYRVNDLATFGLGAGFSRDSSDIGNNGTKSTTEGVVAAMYGSLRPTRNVFIDGVLGYGTLNFDATRYIADGVGFATGSRHGDQLFGAIVAGIEYRGEGWLLSPYGRLERTSTTLDQYTETAAASNALTYFKQTVRTSSGTLGLRAEGQYVSSIGTWVPRARVEFRHQFNGADDAALAYADLASAGPAYIVHTTNQDTGNWSAGLGARLLMRKGLTLTIDYSSNLDVGSARSQSIMFSIAAPLY